MFVENIPSGIPTNAVDDVVHLSGSIKWDGRPWRTIFPSTYGGTGETYEGYYNNEGYLRVNIRRPAPQENGTFTWTIFYTKA